MRDRIRCDVMYVRLDLVDVSLWKGTEDAHGDGSDDQSTANGLQEYRVLDLAEGRFLNPDLTIQDLAEDVTLLVSGHPWFVLVAVGAGEGVE